MNKEIMKKAHELTRELKAEFPNIDYKAQLGICIKHLLNEAKTKAEKIEIKATENVEEIKKAIAECKEVVSGAIEGLDFEQISFVITDKIGNNENIMGRYTYKEKKLEVKADGKFMNEIHHTIYHEIGHFVHKEMFNLKTVRLSTEFKSRYAYKSSRENFAEAFADYFAGRFAHFEEEPKRNIQIKKALGIA